MRILAVKDAAAMAGLHALCFPPEQRWSKRQMAGSLTLETTFGLGVFEEETLVGFLLAQRTREETEVLTLCVHQDKRKQGLGAALVQELLAHREEGSVFLEVAEDNTDARRLYEKLGFKAYSRRAQYYKRAEGRMAAVLYRYFSES